MAFQSNPFQRSVLPEVVKNLLIINGLFFFATYLLAQKDYDLGNTLGLHYFQAPTFRSYQLITYMFMHGSFAHIAFNMFALWMFGSVMESEWGPKKFLIYYFVCGIGAGLVQNFVTWYDMQPVITLINDYVAQPGLQQFSDLYNSEILRSHADKDLGMHFDSFYQTFRNLYQQDPQAAFKQSVEFMTTLRHDVFNVPVVVGASGAVFGLLLAYGMTFPNNLIYLYFFIPVRAKYFVLFYGLAELYYGVNVKDNIAHFAHLGGLLFGLLLILYWRSQNRNRFDNRQW